MSQARHSSSESSIAAFCPDEPDSGEFLFNKWQRHRLRAFEIDISFAGYSILVWRQSPLYVPHPRPTSYLTRGRAPCRETLKSVDLALVLTMLSTTMIHHPVPMTPIGQALRGTR